MDSNKSRARIKQRGRARVKQRGRARGKRGRVRVNRLDTGKSNKTTPTERMRK